LPLYRNPWNGLRLPDIEEIDCFAFLAAGERLEVASGNEVLILMFGHVPFLG
jgi:hypothetical protein